MGQRSTRNACEHSSRVLESSQTPRMSSRRDRSILIGRRLALRSAPQRTDLKLPRVNTEPLTALRKIPASGHSSPWASCYSYTSPPSYGCCCRVDRGVAPSLDGFWWFCSSPGLGLLHFLSLRRPSGIGRTLTERSLFARRLEFLRQGRRSA